MAKKSDKNLFDISKVVIRDLDGNEVAVPIDQKDFANTIYTHANSIDMDDFARDMHKNGKALVNDVVKAELTALLPQMYRHRVVVAFQEQLNLI